MSRDVYRVKKQGRIKSIFKELIPDEINIANLALNSESTEGGLGEASSAQLQNIYTYFFFRIAAEYLEEDVDELVSMPVTIETYKDKVYAECQHEEGTVYLSFSDDCRKVYMLEVNGETVFDDPEGKNVEEEKDVVEEIDD